MVRRALIAASAILSTVSAHFASHDGMQMLPMAPLMWGTIVCAMALIGPRHVYRPRGPIRTFFTLASLQLIAHVVLLIAPWSLGLSTHHASAGIELALLAGALPHMLAAVVLTLVLHGVDQILAAAITIGRAFSRVLGWMIRRHTDLRHPARWRTISTPNGAFLQRADRSSSTPRGPPVTVYT